MTTPSAKQISKRYLRRVAASETLPDVTVARLIDLVNFEIALGTYIQWLVAQGRKSDPLLTEGKTLLRRMFPSIKGGIQRHLGDVSQDAPGNIKTSYERALMGQDIRAMSRQIDYFSDLLPWLLTRQNLLKNVFGSQRTVMVARNVAGMVQEEGPESRLNKAASIVPASKFQLGRKWILKAAKAVGAGLTETEQVLADADYAKGLGTELQTIEAKLSQTDANTPEAADLEDQRLAVLDQIESVAQDTPDKSVVLAAAASAKAVDREYVTKIGQHMRLSKDQEDAMMVQGRAVIAAGAGSGKTRVLAAKVAYHIQELGVPPSAVMATSFTRKSSAELIKRIEEKAGVKLDKGDMGGFGTTHAIAGGILNTLGQSFKRSNYIGRKEGWKQVTILRLAMEQVQMRGGGEDKAPEPVGFWEGKAVGEKSPGVTPADAGTSGVGGSAPNQMPAVDEMDEYLDAITDAERYFDYILRVADNPGVRGWAERSLSLLSAMKRKNPKELTPNMRAALNKIFTKAQSSAAARVKNYKVAAERGKKTKLDDKVFFKKPAGQWFNLGRALTRGSEGSETPIPLGQFKNAISILKGKGITPSQAWAGAGGYDPQSDEAAVYAAYEWLKGPSGEPEFANLGDMDDILIDTVTAMVSSPKIRRQLQKRYKVVLVDEAQDLNQCVHGDTEVQTPEGYIRIRDIQVGQEVASFVNGRVVFNKVQVKERSSWERGYRIHLKSGKTLCMSPDHQIYATPLTSLPEGQMALYLMYREGMGFRIGTSVRLFHFTRISSGRGAQEQADCAWILEIGDQKEILYKEQALSLQYAVPTYIFEGTVRGCNQERIDRIFQEFGENGRELLDKYDLDFRYPHWVASTVTRGSKNRRVVNLHAHRNSGPRRGSDVSMSWSGDVYELDVPVYQVKGGRYMLHKFSVDYREARQVAQAVVDKTGARLVESLCIDDKKLPLITASALFPGMSVPIWEGYVDLKTTDFKPIAEYKELAQELGVSLEGVGGSMNTGKAEIHEFLRQAQLQHGHSSPLPPIQGSPVTLDEIEAVELVPDGDYWDIAVEGAHNFFGNGVLSHNCQYNIFGLITGYLDPKTLKPSDNKEMTANTYALIGDDKQCVHIDTPIDTPSGSIRAGDLTAEAEVLSYRNGTIVPQTVKHVALSSWERGLRVTTESGRSLTMSPNHRLWATEPQTKDDQIAVYLMYRRDMGFRVGITNKGKVGSEGDYIASYGGRCFMEKAERLWILDICSNREDALLEETRYSLRYGIPTAVFNGENRNLNQSRIETIFEEFGGNGMRLLEERHLSLNHPHWMSQSYTKHGRDRHTVNLIAHSGSSTQVSMEWAGDKFDKTLEGMGIREAPGGRRRLRRWFANYREGLSFAERLASITEANLSHRISTPEGALREIPASALFVGMSLPAREGMSIFLDPIVSIEEVGGQFIDIDVDDASNFFGDGLLSHNSIFEFRGADPELFIDKSDMTEGGDDFKTKLLETNYRSGAAIVNAAQRLIDHNSKQVPMVCKAFEDRNGTGQVLTRPVADTEAAAVSVAEDIQESMKMAMGGETKYQDFGVGVRSNAEAYDYGLEMLKRGIPFKSNARFFNDANTKALIGWLTLVEQGLDSRTQEALTGLGNAVVAPYVGLGGKKLVEILEERTPKDMGWARWLVDGGFLTIYRGPQWAPKIEFFARNVQQVSQMSGDPEALLANLLKLQGIDGKDTMEALADNVRENDDVMAQLAAESENGIPTQEQIEEMAMAPVKPLLGLMRNQNNLDGAMTYIRKLQKVNEKITSSDTEKEIDRDAVTIGTMHSWKGLECPNMFVPMVGGKFPRTPIGRSPSGTITQAGVAPEGPDLWSERRLAYVAITRAEQRCILLDIPHPKFGTRSQFLTEACAPVEGQPRGEDAVMKTGMVEEAEMILALWPKGY